MLSFSWVTRRSPVTCWGRGVWKCPRLRSHTWATIWTLPKVGGDHMIGKVGRGNAEFAQKEGDFSDHLCLTVRCTHVDTSCCRIGSFQNFTFLLQGLSPAVEEHFKAKRQHLSTSVPSLRGVNSGRMDICCGVKLWDTNQVCYWLTQPPLECQWLLFQATVLGDGVFVPFTCTPPSLISTCIVSRGQHLLLSHSSPWDTGCLLYFTVCESS